jgi:Outer membrane protein beta-barrel domain
MKNIFFSTLLVAVFATFSFAQSTDDYKKGEFYVGYSANAIDIRDAGGDPVVLHGVNVSGVYNFSKYVGVKGDFSTHHKESFSLQNYLGGIQIKNNAKEGSRVRPFAHALAGAVVASEGFRAQGGAFSVAVGGGIDIRVNKKVSVRAIQIDYNPYISGGYYSNNVRIGAGIVF